MAPSCKIRYFLNRGLPPRLVALVLGVVLISFSATESAPPLRGEVGGNVTFRCPADKNRKIALFYLQRGDKFVNGFYASKDIPATWNNTRVEPNRTHVHMYSLKISHGGEYKCIIQYEGSIDIISEVSIQLNVTASYSKPTVTTSCDDDGGNLGLGCFIRCASHGGYPGTRMMWNVPVPRNASSQTWRVVNSSEVQSLSTELFNSSSTAYFNCSSGEHEHLSCYVGNVASNLSSVCTAKVKQTSYSTVIGAGACTAFIVVIILGFLLCRCCRKTGDATNNIPEMRVNGSVEEGVALQDKGAEEAP